MLSGASGDVIHGIHHLDCLSVCHRALPVFFAKGGKMLIVGSGIAK